MVKIVTDNGIDLPELIVKKYNVMVIRNPLYFEDTKVCDIAVDEFYARVEKGEIPGTSFIPANELVRAYLNAGSSSILSIHSSSKISGTCNSAFIALNIVESSIKVKVIDSGLASLAGGIVVHEAALEAHKGKGIVDVMKKTEMAIAKTKSIFCIPNLIFLHRIGEMGATKTVFGILRKQIPMFRFTKGEMTVFTNVRSTSQAVSVIMRAISGDISKSNAQKLKILLGYTIDRKICQELEDVLRDHLPIYELHILQINPSVGVHVGPGAWGIAYYLC